jgi:flavorubredoxin
MTGGFEAVQVSDRVYWVGAIDWGLRDFHGYRTLLGTTYNAFLVLADRVTLIDTVKAAFLPELLGRIRSVIDPAKIEYVVSNHAEMDHSGGLPGLLAVARPERLFASPQGAAALAAHFHWDQAVTEVRTGDRVDLGNDGLRFVETRMLHWPDSMFSLLEGRKILFSNDAFGMHLASSERFADDLDEALLQREAARYYANILLPLSTIVRELLAKLPELDLDFGIIAPDHGPIWRREPERIVEHYARWAEQRPARKAVVVYDTMWQSTARMARAVGDGLAAGGVPARLMPLDGCHRSDVATELLDASALVVGSPTMNNQLYPTVADAMTYLEGLKPRNLVGATFGSYGWSGEATTRLREILGEMKIELVGEDLKVKYVPADDDLERCRALGRAVADRVAEICG